MSYLALSASFDYICCGSTVIINIFTLTARGSTADVCRRQILTSKVDPRAVRVNPPSTKPFSFSFSRLDVWIAVAISISKWIQISRFYIIPK